MSQPIYPTLAALFEAVASEHEDGGLASDQPLLAGIQIDDDEAEVLADVNYALSMAGMTAISHFIEDRIAQEGSTGRVFAGFQKLSRVRPQRERYDAIKEQAAAVFIFGEPDKPCVVVGGNLRIVPTTSEDILEHWFVVSDSEEFPICLLARESSPISGQRIFRGFWSSNPDLVQRVVDVLECSVIGEPVAA